MSYCKAPRKERNHHYPVVFPKTATVKRLRSHLQFEGDFAESELVEYYGEARSRAASLWGYALYRGVRSGIIHQISVDELADGQGTAATADPVA